MTEKMRWELILDAALTVIEKIEEAEKLENKLKEAQSSLDVMWDAVLEGRQQYDELKESIGKVTPLHHPDDMEWPMDAESVRDAV